MATFIKEKLKKLDEQTNIDKFGVSVEYQIVMMIRQLSYL